MFPFASMKLVGVVMAIMATITTPSAPDPVAASVGRSTGSGNHIAVTSTELVAGVAAVGGIGYAIGFNAHTERAQPVAELKGGLVFAAGLAAFVRRRVLR